MPRYLKVGTKRHNLSNRRHCLSCVPFGHGFEIRFDQKVVHVQCSVCGRPNGSSRRKRCGSCNTKIRRYRAKAAAISFLGGVCQNPECGWSGPQAGFSFHHLRDKEFTIGNVANVSWSRLREELKKCRLLCVRCHSIEHSTRQDAKLIAEAEKYMGDELVWS